ncbi:MAG: lytic transglycosylase domain-containing protein [bacterium]|nr:lytic transglycosylase domain-containing protein [bacterium]
MAKWLRENAFDDLIVVAARNYNVDPLLIKAVIGRESGFNPNAQLKEVADSSRGLMQILEKTARGIGFSGPVERLFDPQTNITYGTKYLKQMLASSPDVESAISRYNGGYRPQFGFGARATRPGRVCLRTDPATKRCLKWHNFDTGEFGNQAHVDSVMANLAYFRTQPPISPGDLPEIVVTAKPKTPGFAKAGGIGGLIAAALGALAYFFTRR